MKPAAATDWILPDRLFDGETLRGGVALGLAEGKVIALSAADALPDGALPTRISGIVTPGYVDLQVNGGGDVLLNNAPETASLTAIARAHRRLGTVAILPTVITDAPAVLERAVDAILAARDRPEILGLHIEGPHISLRRRGTHAPEHIRPFDDLTLAQVARLCDAGVAVMVTLAPEAVKPGDVARLVARGAIVSIGHTDATAAEVRALLDEGASAFTHLYNAMSQMQGRAPGTVGAAINSTAHVGIICDGHHVADEMIGLALRARPLPDRMFLVSDAMSTVGGSDRFMLYGHEIRVEDGRLVNAEGALAGAHVTMAESVARLITVLGLPPQEALRMAVTVPAGLIDRSALARIKDRPARDLLVLGPDWMPQGTLADNLSESGPAA